MSIFATGISHKTAPIAVRDRLALNPEDVATELERLKSQEFLREYLLLSTCNRTEIYGLIPNKCNVKKETAAIFKSMYPGLDISIDEHLYCFQDEDAAGHLFRVAAGLDSLALGEPQVFGQVKDAFRIANRSSTTGPIINRLVHKAFSVSKKIRTETGIGEGTTSISYAAVEMAQKIFGNLEPLRIMIIGAGETGTLTADHFMQRGARNFIIANRTFERAEKLALALRGSAIRFDKIYQHLGDVDITVTCIGAEEHIITAEKTSQVMKLRKNRPLFFIDLGVPRDVEPSVKKIYNVFSYNIDDLKSVVESNLERRRSAVADAEKIIRTDVEEFFDWYASIAVFPAIKQIQEYCEEIRSGEIAANSTRLNGADLEQVELLTKSIVKKILKAPILQLRENAATRDGPLHAEALLKLFRLNKSEQKKQ